MNAYPLFPARLPPATHARDPETSRAAEARHTASGKRRTHLEIVVDAVRHAPGQSARGYASLLDLELIEVRRRLTDAKHAGLVRMDGEVQLPGHAAESAWVAT